MAQETSYSLLIQSADHVVYHKAPNLCVTVHHGDCLILKTCVVQCDSAPTWGSSTVMLSDPSTEITFQLHHEHTRGIRRYVLGKESTCLGEHNTTIGRLLELCTSKDAVVIDIEKEGKLTGKLTVRLQCEELQAVASIAVKQAKNDSEKLAPGQMTLHISDTVEAGAKVDFATGLEGVISLLDRITKIGDAIAEVHPYAKIAWAILTSVYKVVKAQGERDAKITKLVQAMANTSSHQIDLLARKSQNFEAIAIKIAKKTVECASFIREYCDHKFSGRVYRAVFSNPDKKIDALATELLDLTKSLNHEATIQTALIVYEIRENEWLKQLRLVDADASLRSQCLQGTREDILDDIINRLSTAPDGNNILWLYGVAGAGKSTISTTISQHFRGLGLLGAFIFFDRNKPTTRNARSVIHTIAYSVAKLNPQVQATLSKTIEGDSHLLDAPIRTQFQKLLLDPLTAAYSTGDMCGPILIVLDALDECVEKDSRTALVELLVDEFRKLPSAFRIFITSRPDYDLTSRLQKVPGITSLELALATDKDVTLYLRHHLSDLGDTSIQKLESLSGGLFIWAATVCRFLTNSYNREDKLAKLLASQYDPARSLDELYTIALRESARMNDEKFTHWDDRDFARDAKRVLGSIALAKAPLTGAAMDSLLGLKQGQSSEILGFLGCVIQLADDRTARTLHASFRDYLTDCERSGSQPWFIDQKEQSQSFALGCLRVLNTRLKFNICGLEDSHLLNSQVPDLRARIEKCLALDISYSSKYWANHLYEADIETEELTQSIRDFFSTQFLYWLEVLGLLELVSIGSEMLELVRRYAQSKNQDLEFTLHDAQRFLNGFAPVIAQSVPHIYISALPLAPQQARVRENFAAKFPRTLHYVGPLDANWLRLQKLIRGHTDSVRSVAYSPDGRRIASGSSDTTVCIWDSETGALLGQPLTGHTNLVLSVTFSPDGKRIASGSSDNTVRIWDSETGALLGQPLTGHIHKVFSVTFSPDGRWIVSGSSDDTVRIWDSETSSLLCQLAMGHTDSVQSVAFSPDGRQITSGSPNKTTCIWDSETDDLLGPLLSGHRSLALSVAFSPDGRRIASGLSDNTVCIWDSETGTLLGQPLTGHTNSVLSVAFSPDGRRIASGSSDDTVRIWDSETGTLLGQPLTGHTYSVLSVAFSPNGRLLASGSSDKTIRFFSVAFSPDGRRIASGSSDDTMRIWDSDTSALLSQPLIGHKDFVLSVAFSPDGRWIASGSTDKTVHIWDSETGALLCQPLTGHTNSVQSVAFSPNGRLIASGSSDKTVCIWDTETGALFGLPLKGHTDSALSVAFSPDGRQIASGSLDKTVRIWDLETGTPFGQPLTGHTDFVQSVAFSPNGRRIASGSDDKTVRIWDLETGDLLGQPLTGHTREVFSVAFSPDGRRIASGSSDNTVRIWDSETGALLCQPLKGHTNSVQSVAFSPNGRLIASGSSDKTVCIWDTETGALLGLPLRGHTDSVYSVAFSPDGRWIASGSSDNTVRIWDSEASAPPGQPLLGHTASVQSVTLGLSDNTMCICDSETGAPLGQPLTRHTDSVQSVTFPPDERQIAFSSEDNTTGIWNFTVPSIHNDLVPGLHPGHHSHLKDGWVIDSLDRRIMWVPPWLRDDFCLPWSSLVLGPEGVVKLDLTKFVHGTEWEKCIDPKFRVTR
ncbi:WD40 repeat-like protein [Mycena venus]|uniref:WD40 repeat-like protein n=1 Tax=Mycena venus TaxID=2733690 RepID=A0A8H7CKA9_9AGAR|nr:WD40 repeat-like protein [Mycena venus]